MNKNMALGWLKASKLDLENIRFIIKVEHLTPIVAFHSQQAIEKSLKAYLEYKQLNIPKIHKLQTLYDISQLDFKIDDNTLQLIDKLYIDSRYPGDMGLLPYGQPTLKDAKNFYNLAKTFFDKICKITNIEIKYEL